MNMIDDIYTARTELEESQLRVPSEAKLSKICSLILFDDDFTFPRIKLDGRLPLFELPDPDGIKVCGGFQGVILYAKKSEWQSPEDAAAGNDPTEKRLLYLIRAGRCLPEIMWVSPTSVRNWKLFLRDLGSAGLLFSDVMSRFSTEQLQSSRYTWSKPVWKGVRLLNQAEKHYVAALREVIKTRIRRED